MLLDECGSIHYNVFSHWELHIMSSGYIFHLPRSTLCLCSFEQGLTSSSGLALSCANLAAVATSLTHELLLMHLITFSVGALKVNSKRVVTVIQVNSVAKVGAERDRQVN